ncbi:thiamine-phosphate kinase [Candidatus Paraluminiphilus aquimaris]|uniref:Thiamine-monophosphate kinase n=1 Tax=Candidatus Paraluminiphilus aquimaris TaxID=2518994 RepID=A0ABY6Q593_9GAMM|nr:thiamine-phosphate kinase [Candidatus Paraluminiphilus aquimaris]UZP74061.1 thiamine-phosphate kinase [Candidatus Paraluminiphilus aquimaris]
MSEFDIITHYFSSLGAGENVRLSVGDDAAALRVDDGFELLVSTDTSAAGVHFPEDLFPEDIAYKAVAAAASDLAAMGASPLGMTLAISLPEHDSLWLHGFSQGLASASRDFNLPLIGGDTTRGLLSMTLTVMGQCPEGQKLLRSGARPTDLVCVSGSLGDSTFGLSMLQGNERGLDIDFEDQEYLLSRFSRPASRIELGERLRAQATSCIDISDGLLADATHIANASGCKLVIDSALIPLSTELVASVGRARAIELALTGGEDFELLFTLPESVSVPDHCTVIGFAEAGEGVLCDGVLKRGGYDHFH